MNSPSDTRRILEGCVEALLLGYWLDESATQFELVCEFWEKASAADRAFVRFRFDGVHQFSREQGAFLPLRGVDTRFAAWAVGGSWVIQSVCTGQVGTLGIAWVSMGDSFGAIEFRFRDATWDVVHLYAKPDGLNAWSYCEVGTHQPVDFYNPFGSAWLRRDAWRGA